MAKHRLEFYTKHKIDSCDMCRLKVNVAVYYETANWVCSPFNRYITKFVNQDKKPKWCPLVEINDEDEIV